MVFDIPIPHADGPHEFHLVDLPPATGHQPSVSYKSVETASPCSPSSARHPPPHALSLTVPIAPIAIACVLRALCVRIATACALTCAWVPGCGIDTLEPARREGKWGQGRNGGNKDCAGGRVGVAQVSAKAS